MEPWKLVKNSETLGLNTLEDTPEFDPKTVVPFDLRDTHPELFNRPHLFDMILDGWQYLHDTLTPEK